MADWNIRPRALQCSDCEKPFTPKMKGHTLLVQSEEGYLRKDLCVDCFKKCTEQNAAFSSAAWAFTIPAVSTKNARKEAPVKKETAIQLLRKLIARENPADVGAIYILAILLERNKQFIERDVRQNAEGALVRLYEFKATGEVFTIEAPDLRPDNLASVQQRVIDLLEGKESLTSQPTPPAESPRAKVKRLLHIHWYRRAKGVKRFRKV
jgi:hypothetical protein